MCIPAGRIPLREQPPRIPIYSYRPFYTTIQIDRERKNNECAILPRETTIGIDYKKANFSSGRGIYYKKIY